jgi:hypothetical protein
LGKPKLNFKEKKVRITSFALIATFLLIVIGCSSVTVRTDHDPEYDFNKFKTYRWASAQEINPNDELAKHPLVLKRVQAAVDGQLKSKGFSLIESGNPDFVVIAHAGVKDRMQVYNTGGYYGGWYDPWWGPYGGSTQVSYYEEGTLVIDFVVWEKKELGWRGMGTKTLSDNPNPEKVQREIDHVVGKIMAEFPPKAM